jgi:hypothetical protein
MRHRDVKGKNSSAKIEGKAMMQLFVLCIVVLLSIQGSAAQSHSYDKQGKNAQGLLPAVFPLEDLSPTAPAVSPAITSTPHFPGRTQGAYTGITGFFDYQTNTGAPQHIRVDPADSTGRHFHVSKMQFSDPASPGPSRGSRYAFLADGGAHITLQGHSRKRPKWC